MARSVACRSSTLRSSTWSSCTTLNSCHEASRVEVMLGRTRREDHMDKRLFQGWLDRYVAAWQSYDAAAIGDLFTADAAYRYHPWDAEPVNGRDAIVADWVDNRDAEGSWRASYSALAC